MSPKKKNLPESGKRSFSRDELSVLGRKRWLEDDLDADPALNPRRRGKDGFEQDLFWDEPDLPEEDEEF